MTEEAIARQRQVVTDLRNHIYELEAIGAYVQAAEPSDQLDRETIKLRAMEAEAARRRVGQ